MNHILNRPTSVVWQDGYNNIIISWNYVGICNCLFCNDKLVSIVNLRMETATSAQKLESIPLCEITSLLYEQSTRRIPAYLMLWCYFYFSSFIWKCQFIQHSEASQISYLLHIIYILEANSLDFVNVDDGAKSLAYCLWHWDGFALILLCSTSKWSNGNKNHDSHTETEW